MVAFVLKNSRIMLLLCTIMLLHSCCTKEEVGKDWFNDINKCNSLYLELKEKQNETSSPSMTGCVMGEIIEVLHRKDSLSMLVSSEFVDEKQRKLWTTEYDAWTQLKTVLMDFSQSAIEVKYWDDPWKHVYGWYLEEDVSNLHIGLYSEKTPKQATKGEDIDGQKSQILQLCDSTLDKIMIVSDKTNDPISIKYSGRVKYNKECAIKAIKLLPSALEYWAEANFAIRGEEATAEFLFGLCEIIKEDTK